MEAAVDAANPNPCTAVFCESFDGASFGPAWTLDTTSFNGEAVEVSAMHALDARIGMLPSMQNQARARILRFEPSVTNKSNIVLTGKLDLLKRPYSSSIVLVGLSFSAGAMLQTFGLDVTDKGMVTGVSSGSGAQMPIAQGTWTDFEMRLACTGDTCTPTLVVGGMTLGNIPTLSRAGATSFRVFAGLVSFMPNEPVEVLIDNLELRAM